MKNKIKLLILSASTLFGLVGVGTTVLHEVDNAYAVTANVDGLEGARVAKAAQYDTNIDFGNGLGSEYLSNVKVQYGNGTNEGTGSIRLVAAVKGQVISSSSVYLPGTYGFHVSYDNGSEVKDFMYDVDYVYHSISETINGNTRYYTNDYSSFLASEGRKTVADWAGDANSEYNLFIALKIDNIPEEKLDNIITVQPYLVTEEETLTSANVRYANTADAKNAYSSHYLDTSNGLLKLSSTDGVTYGRGDVVLNAGEKANIVDQYGNVLEEYTVTRTGSYYAEYNGTDYHLWSGVADKVIEAEYAALDFGSLYKSDSTASNGAYIGDINKAGQGLQYYYFSYAAGEFDLDAYYVSKMTDNPTSKVLVNDEEQGYFEMENVGVWNDMTKAKVATVKVKLNKGWNKINILKGNSYAQFDKFVLKAGTGFDLREFDGYDFNVAPSYRLEAELGTPLLKNAETGKWKYDSSKYPRTVAGASLGYYIGGIDALGQGVEWAFNAPVAGRYQVKVSVGQASGATGNSLYFYHSTSNYRDSVPNADDMKAVETIMNLQNAGTGWGKFSVDSATITLDLKKGYNFIYALKGVSSSYVELDYAELTYVGK